MAEPVLTAVSAVAHGGHVDIRIGEHHAVITPEEADIFWNQVAEAELVALEQRVRARRRVTDGARGGWVNAPAQGRHAHTHDYPHEHKLPGVACPCMACRDEQREGRHAVDAGMALAESTAAALNLLAGPGDCTGRPGCPVHRTRTYAGHAATVPGDPYAAPDYQHPEPDDEWEPTDG